jgi:hypothetical protein
VSESQRGEPKSQNVSDSVHYYLMIIVPLEVHRTRYIYPFSTRIADRCTAFATSLSARTWVRAQLLTSGTYSVLSDPATAHPAPFANDDGRDLGYQGLC